jgi:hypothetical protein
LAGAFFAAIVSFRATIRARVKSGRLGRAVLEVCHGAWQSVYRG